MRTPKNKKIIRNFGFVILGTGILYLLNKKTQENPIIDNNSGQSSSTFFFPPVSTMALRSDILGDGIYGASRGGGSRSHNGIDIITYQGEIIYSPIDGVMVRIANPYADDPNYSGLLIKGINQFKDIEMKIFYMFPFLSPGNAIYAGQSIGFSQSISQKWGNQMIDHIHVEVRENGELINPTALFFQSV